MSNPTTILPPLTESELREHRRNVQGTSDCGLRPLTVRLIDECLARLASDKAPEPKPKKAAAVRAGTRKTSSESVSEKWTEPHEVKG